MIKKKYCIIFILLFMLLGCEKESILDIPEVEKKLVVNSVLVADNTPNVFVGLSNSVLDTHILHLDSALVTLQMEGAGKDTLQHKKNGYYGSEKMIQQGIYYTLMVQAKGYNKIISKTQVPQPIFFIDYSFDLDAGISKEGFKNKQITVSFEDPPGISNYYMLLLTWSTLDSAGVTPSGYISNNEWNSTSPVIVAEGNEYQNAFSDDLFNGEIVSIPMNFNVFDFDVYYDLKFKLKIYLVTISEEYYKYKKSFDLLNAAEDNLWLSNSPPQLYSNIADALGVFSSVNVTDSIVIIF